jgi:hypothetical protein
MKRNLIILIVAIGLIFFAGCLSGSPSSGTNTSDITPTDTPKVATPTVTPEVNTSTPTPEGVCIRGTPNGIDQGGPECLVDEKPPDIRIDNFDNESHVVSVRIIRNGSTVTYENNVTIEPAGGDGYIRRVLKDVIDAPGEYEIRATVDGEYSDSVTWTVGERYTETGSEQWEINLDWEYKILVKRVATM